MLEKINKVSNPLSIIAIFAGITEVGGTIVLPLLNEQNQQPYMIFLIVFPCILIASFFLTLNFNNKVLYAPSDFVDENNFVKLINIQFKEMEHRLEKSVEKELKETVAKIETSISTNDIINRAKVLIKEGKYDKALEEANNALEINKSGAAYSLKSIILSRKHDYNEAVELCSKGLEFESSATTTASLHWNRACYKALAKQDIKSILTDLENAIYYNISLIDKLDTDKDLDAIRNVHEFVQFRMRFNF